MISKKTDTIQGFLSPTKLLSSGSRNGKYNQGGNKSPLNTSSYKKGEDSKYNSQNYSQLNTSRDLQKQQYDNSPSNQAVDTNFSRLTGGYNNNTKMMNTQPVDRKYESDRNIPIDKDSKTVNNYPAYGYRRNNMQISEEDQNAGILNGKINSRALEEINNRKWESEKYRDEDRQSPLYQPKLKNDPTATFRQNPSLHKSSIPQIPSFISGSAQLMTTQCYELIRKLSKIKENLELQILELQRLLDNTSKYMDNMEEQFDKIKESILAYTAKSLDNAFAEYKQNMVQWQKYEDFQRKSLSMLQEINEYIYNEEQKLSESNKLSSRQLTMVAQDLDKQIQYYRQFTEEIAKIRDQCVGMRPTLTQERIKQFEKGLAILCHF